MRVMIQLHYDCVLAAKANDKAPAISGKEVQSRIAGMDFKKSKVNWEAKRGWNYINVKTAARAWKEQQWIKSLGMVICY